jgi:hypothetical protein
VEDREDSQVEVEAVIGARQPQTKKLLRLPEAGRGKKEPPLTPVGTCHTLVLDFYPPELFLYSTSPKLLKFQLFFFFFLAVLGFELSLHLLYCMRHFSSPNIFIVKDHPGCGTVGSITQKLGLFCARLEWQGALCSQERMFL